MEIQVRTDAGPICPRSTKESKVKTVRAMSGKRSKSVDTGTKPPKKCKQEDLTEDASTKNQKGTRRINKAANNSKSQSEQCATPLVPKASASGKNNNTPKDEHSRQEHVDLPPTDETWTKVGRRRGATRPNKGKSKQQSVSIEKRPDQHRYKLKAVSSRKKVRNTESTSAENISPGREDMFSQYDQMIQTIKDASWSDIQRFVSSHPLPELNKRTSNFHMLNDMRDVKAQQIIPSDIHLEDPYAIETTGDGNCLFNAASRLICGDERLAHELRIRAMVEAVRNFDDYVKEEVLNRGREFDSTKKPDKETHATRDFYVNTGGPDLAIARKRSLNREKSMIRALIELLKDAAVPNVSCGMWTFHHLASVINTPILVIHPENNSKGESLMGTPLRWHLNRCILPLSHQEQQNIEDGICIMWAGSGVTFNHFVAIVAPKTVEQILNPFENNTKAKHQTNREPKESGPVCPATQPNENPTFNNSTNEILSTTSDTKQRENEADHQDNTVIMSSMVTDFFDVGQSKIVAGTTESTEVQSEEKVPGECEIVAVTTKSTEVQSEQHYPGQSEIVAVPSETTEVHSEEQVQGQCEIVAVTTKSTELQSEEQVPGECEIAAVPSEITEVQSEEEVPGQSEIVAVPSESTEVHSEEQVPGECEIVAGTTENTEVQSEEKVPGECEIATLKVSSEKQNVNDKKPDARLWAQRTTGTPNASPSKSPRKKKLRAFSRQGSSVDTIAQRLSASPKTPTESPKAETSSDNGSGRSRKGKSPGQRIPLNAQVDTDVSPPEAKYAKISDNNADIDEVGRDLEECNKRLQTQGQWDFMEPLQEDRRQKESIQDITNRVARAKREEEEHYRRLQNRTKSVEETNDKPLEEETHIKVQRKLDLSDCETSGAEKNEMQVTATQRHSFTFERSKYLVEDNELEENARVMNKKIVQGTSFRKA